MFTKYEIVEMLIQEISKEKHQMNIEYLLRLSDEALSDKFQENCGAKLQRVSNNLFMIKY
jgi:hypothetical protein